ncbi:MAG: hypothetical protein CVT92_06040 [Bacteroidetes bacterium HGW-Bacteroidetes-1]|jgi:hypothetical protein|nr:MAG: hypothetical protein CVT92_06040 [Bacteroidetes bacterium HGW-Bacteroidetes-1]
MLVTTKMKKQKSTSIILWILSVLLMASLAIYQRTTGPTYPVSGKIALGGTFIKYKLFRSYDTGSDALIEISVPEGVKAVYKYKRFKSHDEWTNIELVPDNGKIIANIPHQPAAGKVEYQIALIDGVKAYPLTEEPVVIRFKGSVPDYVLIPHIFFMFFAMVFSLRTGLEALLKRPNTYYFTTATLLLFTAGGLILGPIVQKYAFDAYWTGWPWGHDLTDNKTLAAFIFWFIAWLVLRRNHENRLWPVVAMFVMLAVYLIPHSVLGSEIDHTKIENQINKTEQQE